MADDLTCPSCGTPIQITQALSQQLTQKLRTDLQGQFEKERAKLEALQKEKEKEHLVLKKSLEEQNEKYNQLLEEEKKKLELQVKERLDAASKQLEVQTRKKIEEEIKVQQRDLANQLEEKELKIKQAQELEIQLRRQMRAQEEKEKELALELERRLDEERKEVVSKVQKQVADQFTMQLAEKEKVAEDLRKKIEELQLKATEQSVQIRGEILELQLEAFLRELFPMDTVDAVGKGKFGADVVQNVRDQYGRMCGVILWESKHTKTWMNEWLPKLREDVRTAKAHVAVLVSQTMPEGCSTFMLKDGVWVTCYECVAGLATALRQQLIYIATERNASHGREEKMEMLYNYLIGHEFRQRVEALVEVFQTMRKDLEVEKTAMERLWKKREMQVARLALNTSRMYGEMQGLVGSSLAAVSGLELESPADVKEAKSLLDLMG